MKKVVHFFTDGDRGITDLSIDITKVSGIHLVKKNLCIVMDNGIMYVVTLGDDERIHFDLLGAFNRGFVGDNDDLLHNGVKVLKIEIPED